MKKIELTKIFNRYVITGFTDGASPTTMQFKPTENGRLEIGRQVFEVKSGIAEIKNTDLADGIYTPIIISGDKKILCERISVSHGSIEPYENGDLRSIRNAEKIIKLELMLSEVKSDVSMLCESVYCKKIF